MRGTGGTQEALFTGVKLEVFVPADHPLRPIRLRVNESPARPNGYSCSRLWQAAVNMRATSAAAVMPTTLEILQSQVMSLSKEDRSRLLERLAASLDVDAEVEAGWEQLTAQCEAGLESGAVVGIPLEEAMAQLRARFPGWPSLSILGHSAISTKQSPSTRGKGLSPLQPGSSRRSSASPVSSMHIRAAAHRGYAADAA
jgi:hypothetical protein